MSASLLFSTLLDWFCIDWLEISGSLSLCSRDFGNFCVVSVLFSGTQLFFFAGLLGNLGKVPLSLRSDFDDFYDVYAGGICSPLHICK